MSRIINQAEVDLMNEELKALNSSDLEDMFDMLSVKIDRLQKSLDVKVASDIYPLFEATLKIMPIAPSITNPSFFLAHDDNTTLLNTSP
ncbi:hypothetical protein CCP3SC1AL1_4620002 [Gammaproteobacteria bacterium]